MIASGDEGDIQPRGTSVKSGMSAPHPYQTSSAGTRMAGPASRGMEVADVGNRGSDSRKPGVDVSGADYRQFDHTTVDREVVIAQFLLFIGIRFVMIISGDCF